MKFAYFCLLFNKHAYTKVHKTDFGCYGQGNYLEQLNGKRNFFHFMERK